MQQLILATATAQSHIWATSAKFLMAYSMWLPVLCTPLPVPASSHNSDCEVFHRGFVLLLITLYLVSAAIECPSTLPTAASATAGTPTGLTYLSTVTYTCDIGYELSNGVDTQTVTCQDDKSWSTPEACTGNS